MWYAPMGFCISFIGGWLLSVGLALFGLEGESTIYTDVDRRILNADLFSPPIAKQLRKRNAEILEKSFTVNIRFIYFSLFYCFSHTNYIRSFDFSFFQASNSAIVDRNYENSSYL